MTQPICPPFRSGTCNICFWSNHHDTIFDFEYCSDGNQSTLTASTPFIMILLLFGYFKGIFQSIFWIFLISQQLQYALQALMFIYYVPVNRKLIYTSVTFPLFVQESRRTNICLIALIVVCCLLPYFYQCLCITLKETCLTLFWYVMIAHCPKLKS